MFDSLLLLINILTNGYYFECHFYTSKYKQTEKI